MQKLLFHKLLYEYQAYCTDVLDKPKIDIFNLCYEIDAIVNIYEIMAASIDKMSVELVTALLKINGILQYIYSEWLKRDDGCWTELEEHVKEELSQIENEGYIMEEAA